MQRCLELAQNGLGFVSPNPLVGCVIVHHENIIGEGWHKTFGQAHAEVNAINAVTDKELLREATLYVNLEPCSHQGKTPPCADLIIQHQLKKVVVGMIDPFEKVAGSGIQKLRDAGIEVECGVMEKECRELNRRFIKYVTQRKPYVVLKWAQTVNGFIAPDRNKLSAEAFEEQRHITGRVVQKWVHKMRTEEDAIMVGTNTALFDNPALNAREWEGRNPLRMTIDRSLRLPAGLKMFDGSQPTLVFTEQETESKPNLQFIKVDFNQHLLEQVLSKLYERHIQSLIVEGGTLLLSAFIKLGLWDEAIVLTAPKLIDDGVPAPHINGSLTRTDELDGVHISYIQPHAAF